MNHITVHIKLDFILAFFKNQPTDTLQNDKYLVWRRFLVFLYNNCQLYLYGNKKTLAENLDNQFLFEIANRYSISDQRIEILDKEFVKEIHPFTIYLDQYVEKLILQLMTEHTFVTYKQNGFPNTLNSWNQLKEKLIPFKNLIIVDQYLLNESRSTRVISSMLKILSSENDTNISLFYYNKQKKNTPEEYPINDIISDLGELIPNLTKSLSVTKHTNIHDRILITDYQICFSSNSFWQYFDEHERVLANKPIILDIRPFSLVNNQNNWGEIAKAFLRIFKEKTVISIDVLGDRTTNELLK